MPKRIKYIKLDSFKGATQPFLFEFDTEKPITLIFGENGSGKSTLVDAVDFIFNENLGSLEDKKIGHSKHKYLHSILSSPDKLKVEINVAGLISTGKITKSGEKVIDKKDGVPSFEILRRSQILNVINAEPKDKFNEIKKFIDVTKCQKNEDSLRKARDSVKSNYNDAANSYTQSDDQLKKLWEQEGKPGKYYLTWAESKAKLSTIELDKYVKDAEKIIRYFERLEQSTNDVENKSEEVIKLKSSVEEKTKQYEEAKKSSVDNAEELIKTLQSAKSYIEKTKSIKECPVCKKSILPKELISDIDKRLADFKKPIELKKSLDDAEAKYKRELAVLESKKISVQGDAFSLFNYCKDASLDEIRSMRIDWGKNKDLLTKSESYDEKYFTSSIKLYKELSNAKKEIEKGLDSSRETLRQITAIKTNLDTRNEKKILASECEKKLKKLTELHYIVEKTRKDFLDSVLAEISNTIDEYYQKMHPDEGIGKIKCFMKSGGISSLDILAKFHSVDDIPPAAYYSESHLDTLGVCVFIALAKHYNIYGTVLVFDDILTSVDVEHLERFMELLSDLGDEFEQIILTTHYRPLRERYRYARGAVGNVSIKELRNWNIDKGMYGENTENYLTDLKKYLIDKGFDRQIAASKGGVLLESLLDHLTFTYQCKLPRRSHPPYTIADLFVGLTKKLTSAIKIEEVVPGSTNKGLWLKPILDKLDSKSWIRNVVGAHYNQLGMELTDKEIKEFGETVVNFAETMICEKCFEIPGRDKSGSYFECKCKTKRLYPLKEPK